MLYKQIRGLSGELEGIACAASQTRYSLALYFWSLRVQRPVSKQQIWNRNAAIQHTVLGSHSALKLT